MTEPTTEPTDWTLAEIAQREQHLISLKASLLARLRALDCVARIDIEYDGEGDDGQIQSIAGYDAQEQLLDLFGLRIDCPNTDPTVASGSIVALPAHGVIEDFAWDILRAHHDGFENNEGGFGEITINVTAGTVLLEHRDRIIDLSLTVTEL